MIRVLATHDGTGQVLADMRIEWLEQVDEDWHRYSLQVGVESIDELQMHQRTFYHKRLHSNTLALMIAALTSLENEDLQLPEGTSVEQLAKRFKEGNAEAPQAWNAQAKQYLESHSQQTLLTGQALQRPDH